MASNRFYSCLIVLFILPCLLSSSLKTIAISANISTDQSALLAIKAHITHDPSNILAKNWTTDTSVCTWFGVICGSRHKRVTTLNLSNMDLTGTIPPHLGNLSFLIVLQLSYNMFHGSLPAELSRLRRIKLFSFRSNNLTGEIPTWIGLLPNLEHLFLQRNEFSGPIPETIFNASSPLQAISLRKNLVVSVPFFAISNMSLLRAIDFAENKLSPSKIPAYMFNRLSKLEYLNLENNKFYGEMPSTLFNLNEMRELYLDFNNLSGNIPNEIKNLTLLTYLYLNNNSFTGTIPREIGNLSLLKEIQIGHNRFHGQIPQEIGLPNLEHLDLQFNNLYGPIPLTFFNISSITLLALGGNMLSGSLPSSLWLPNLEMLYLGPNNLTGLVPESIFNSSKLSLIDLANNSFSGSIPSTLGRLRNLEILNLHDNSFSDDPNQPILTSLSQLGNLKFLNLASNPLKSILPISIGNLSSIQKFFVSKCEIRGVIPTKIGNLSNMIALGLRNNRLNGSIPSSIGRLRKLQGLFLERNNLNGHIPNELCHLESLAELNLYDNNLSGPLPEYLNRLTSLRYLHLGSNNISSTIPSSLWDLSYILTLDLSCNFINGSLPLQIANLKVLTMLDISQNKISGNIPSQIGDLQNLATLSLGHNQLQGSIPNSFGQLVSLDMLDLSQNNLTGEIPKSLEALKYLKYINLSFNSLSGEIPAGGPFTNFSAESFIWNEHLCGPSHLQVPPCKAIARHRSEGGIPQSLKIILLGIALAALILVLAYFLRKRIMGRVNHLPNANTKEFGALRRVSYFELQQATNGFDKDNVIGVGSFGTVYKGTLSDGKEVAVKVFNLQHQETGDTFDVECQVICNIRHRNLIKVISSCSNLEFKAIVLDYMPNGSLERWLYFPNHSCLNIIQRLDILIDVAEALQYLHNGCSPSIVHCDLKPSNVLLDQDIVAHVADFGMAKLLGRGESMTQTMTLATIGYMAPEYGLEGIISTRGDVFSFGILVMETFTGKKPTNNMFSGEISLKSWVENSITHSLSETIDAKLLSNETDPSESKKHYISSILGVALDCCREAPQERANMKDVVAALNKIKAKLLKADGGAS